MLNEPFSKHSTPWPATTARDVHEPFLELNATSHRQAGAKPAAREEDVQRKAHTTHVQCRAGQTGENDERTRTFIASRQCMTKYLSTPVSCLGWHSLTHSLTHEHARQTDTNASLPTYLAMRSMHAV